MVHSFDKRTLIMFRKTFLAMQFISAQWCLRKRALTISNEKKIFACNHEGKRGEGACGRAGLHSFAIRICTKSIVLNTGDQCMVINAQLRAKDLQGHSLFADGFCSMQAYSSTIVQPFAETCLGYNATNQCTRTSAQLCIDDCH